MARLDAFKMMCLPAIADHQNPETSALLACLINLNVFFVETCCVHGSVKFSAVDRVDSYMNILDLLKVFLKR